MELTPETKAFLEKVNAVEHPDYATLTPEFMREELFQVTKIFGSPYRDVQRVMDFMAPSTHDGPEIPCRLYVPHNLKHKGLFVYAHGGGWLRGDIPTYDTNMRAFCDIMGIAVVSIHYRRSPEHRFPCHQHDVMDAYNWCHQNMNELGVEEGQVYLSGDSGGANITLGVLCMLIDQKMRIPDIYFGIYPPTDLRMNYESYKTYESGYLLTTKGVDFYVRHYLASEEERNNQYASPILYPHLDKFPKTVIVTAEADPLYGEQMAFVDKLKLANVDVHQKIYPGTIHPFVLLAGVFPEGEDAIAWMGEHLF
jgi:acetyl esterase